MDYQFSDKIKTLKPSAIREIFKATADPAIIPFSAGNPAGESFPVEKMAAVSADIWENSAVQALQYGITEGYTPLREKMANRLKTKFGAGRDFDELIITSGGQQALDLTAKVMCNEGDTILTESPSFIGALNAYRAYNVNLVGVPMEDDGVDLDALEQAMKSQKNVKIFYTIPSFHNPLGICTSLQKRKAVYELCKKYGVLILEDNPYGELRFTGEDIPTIKSMDTEGIVVYAGTLSKVFSAGMRVGFCLGPQPVVQKIVVAKQVNDVHTNQFFQMLVDEFLNRYDLDEHIKHIQDIYRRKAKLMLDGIDTHFPACVKSTRPEGGLFLWCTLPESVDLTAFVKYALEKQVAVVPGSAFSINENEPSHAFRLNYSQPTDEQIVRGCEILGKCLREFIK